MKSSSLNNSGNKRSEAYSSNDAEFKMDVLREVGNIGAGNAATALSKMLEQAC